jgi:hypothetical protein
MVAAAALVSLTSAADPQNVSFGERLYQKRRIVSSATAQMAMAVAIKVCGDAEEMLQPDLCAIAGARLAFAIRRTGRD